MRGPIGAGDCDARLVLENVGHLLLSVDFGLSARETIVKNLENLGPVEKQLGMSVSVKFYPSSYQLPQLVQTEDVNWKSFVKGTQE